MKISNIVVLFFGLISITSFVHAEPVATLPSELQYEIERYIELKRSPGISVAVSINDSLAFSGQAGFSNLELGTNVSRDSVFRIGSITKQFTAAAILKLQEMKRLSTNDSILKHLPGMPSSWRAIRITDLLNHTSGIVSYTDISNDIGRMDRPITHNDVVDLIRNEKLQFNPGEKWQYSNSNSYLLGMIIENTSGKTYETFLNEELLRVLSPHNISYCHTDKLIKSRVAGYVKGQTSNNTVAWRNSSFLNMLMPFSAGGLCATSEDLIRWNLALTSGKIISSESHEAMTTNRKLNDGSSTDYGYGIGIRAGESGVEIFHLGGIPGFRSSLIYYPEKNIGIAVLINDEDEEALEVSNTLRKYIVQAIDGSCRDQVKQENFSLFNTCQSSVD